MTKAVTTTKQYELLVSFMEDNPDLAKGYCTTSDARILAKTLWEEISTRLNSNGPPIRSSEGWKKVWSDFKFHIKKKIKLNKTSISGTGGGPPKLFTFSALEETVIRLIDLRRVVEGISGTQSFGDAVLELPVTVDSPSSTDGNDPNRENVQDDVIVELQTPRAATRNRSKQTLLEDQISLQQRFHENISIKLNDLNNSVTDTNKTLKRLVRLKEKSHDLQKRKMELKEKEMVLREKEIKLKEKSDLEKQKLKLEDLEIKKQNLEIEAAKL